MSAMHKSAQWSQTTKATTTIMSGWMIMVSIGYSGEELSSGDRMAMIRGGGKGWPLLTFRRER